MSLATGDPLHITIHRGSHEIGGNCVELGTETKRKTSWIWACPPVSGNSRGQRIRPADYPKSLKQAEVDLPGKTKT